MTEATQRLAMDSLKEAYYPLINIARKELVDWEIINFIELAIAKLQNVYIEEPTESDDFAFQQQKRTNLQK